MGLHFSEGGIKIKKIEFEWGYIKFPDDWLILGEIEKANYVGVVSCRSSYHDVPRFIFASDKPINRLTPEEERAILGRCAEACERFSKAHKEAPTTIGIFDITILEGESELADFKIVRFSKKNIEEFKDGIKQRITEEKGE